MTQQVLITLDGTGSISVNALDIISRYPEKLRVFALAGHRQVEKLAMQCTQFTPEYTIVTNAEHAIRLEALLKARSSGTHVLCRVQTLIDVAPAGEVDGMMYVIADAVGLPSTLVAAQKSKTTYLANKEALVVSSMLLMRAAQTNNVRVLPVDSEHDAIFQVLPHNYIGRLSGHGIRSITLVASDGPFLDADLAGSEHITPVQVIRRLNWSMGRKILVGSTTMMSKGLELIETHWLFSCPPDNLKVVTHPQSVVHSMVHYLDGSVLAQLGNPDMRTPIAYYLGLPERIRSGVDALDFDTLPALIFRRPDFGRFPCLKLTYDAMYAGGSAPYILNATNEMVVAAFLDRKIRSADIAHVVAHYLDVGFSDSLNDIGSLLASDTQTRIRTQKYAKSPDQ